MKKNIGAQLALYPAPVIGVGAIVNDKPTWTQMVIMNWRTLIILYVRLWQLMRRKCSE